MRVPHAPWTGVPPIGPSKAIEALLSFSPRQILRGEEDDAIA